MEDNKTLDKDNEVKQEVIEEVKKEVVNEEIQGIINEEVKEEEEVNEVGKEVVNEEVSKEVANEEVCKEVVIEEVKVNEDIEMKCDQETITEIKESENQILIANIPETEIIAQEPKVDENTKKNVYEDLEIPDNMEVIQFTELLSPKLIDEHSVKDSNLSLPQVSVEVVPDEIKPESPSPVSTMTCSIDGNTDTEWNVPVAPATGTIKINISQKILPVKPTVPLKDSTVEPQSPPDFTPTFGEIDPDQPPPPGLEMETVVIPKVQQREVKPRLLNNAKKIKEYPVVNKGKEMSGLCSIM